MIAHRIARELERRVSAEDVRRELVRPLDQAEREEVLSLRRWFTRRYGSAEARLAYVRRAYQRWTALRTYLRQ
jgi:hypothetical protein